MSIFASTILGTYSAEAEYLGWAWDGRLPGAGASFFAGRPMEGRRGVAYDLAARKTRGYPWPGGPDFAQEEGNVILMGREWGMSFAQELRGAGVEMGRVTVLDKRYTSGGFARWERALQRTGQASFIYVDNWCRLSLQAGKPARAELAMYQRQYEEIDRWSRDCGIPVILDVCVPPAWASVGCVIDAVRPLAPGGNPAMINVFSNHGCMPFRVFRSFGEDGEELPPLWFHHEGNPISITWWIPPDGSAGRPELLSSSVPPLSLIA